MRAQKQQGKNRMMDRDNDMDMDKNNGKQWNCKCARGERSRLLKIKSRKCEAQDFILENVRGSR
jgi:hypothetical protein